MDTISAIRETMRVSGHGLMKTSKLLGKNNSYLASSFSRGSTPRADTLAKIAKVNGFNLILVPEDVQPLNDWIVIDPN